MKKEYVDVLLEKDFNQVFYQRDGDISELIKLLDILNDDMPIGWRSFNKKYIGWWGRVGFFYPKSEEFYDAFDLETYHTEVWHYSSISQQDTVVGVELQGSLDNTICLYTAHDIANTEYLLLCVDSEA